MPRAATGSPCAYPSPLDPSWEPPEGEKRPYGVLREKMGEWPRGKPSREPAQGKGNPRRAAAQAGNPRKHGRIGAERPAGPPSGAGRLSLSSPRSRGRPKGAEKGPGRPGAPQRVPVTPNHMPGWSWRPAAGSATEGTRPCEPVRAGRTETRRALQAAAPGARTAPIMKGGGPPVRPANRPFDHEPGKTGQNHPVRRRLTQGCGRSDRRQADNKKRRAPGPRAPVKGDNRTMTPAPPAERPRGPGKPPSRAPSRPFSAEAGTSGNPGNWR